MVSRISLSIATRPLSSGSSSSCETLLDLLPPVAFSL